MGHSGPHRAAVNMGDEDRERSPLHELGERGGIGGLFDLTETRDKFRPRGRRSGVNVGVSGGVRSPLVCLVYFSTDNDSLDSSAATFHLSLPCSHLGSRHGSHSHSSNCWPPRLPRTRASQHRIARAPQLPRISGDDDGPPGRKI